MQHATVKFKSQTVLSTIHCFEKHIQEINIYCKNRKISSPTALRLTLVSRRRMRWEQQANKMSTVVYPDNTAQSYKQTYLNKIPCEVIKKKFQCIISKESAYASYHQYDDSPPISNLALDCHP